MSSPLSKRQKTIHALSTSSPASRRSSRQQAQRRPFIFSLAPEIISQIFALLHPLDLLHLARTSQSLRLLLMQKSARPIWKAALRSVADLPGCPSDMSETAFASLIFDRHCNAKGCAKNYVPIAQMMLRTRYCNNCTNTFCCRIPHDETGCCNVRILHFTIPVTKLPGRRGIWCTKADKDQMLVTLKDVPKQNLRAFIDERNREMGERIKHAARCDRWITVSQTIERNQHHKSRLEIITKKLIESGLGHDLEHLPQVQTPLMAERNLVPLERHRLVRKSQRLTEIGWKRIKGKMLEHVEALITTRRDEERAELIQDRRFIALHVLREYNRTHYDWDILFTMPDFYNQEVQDIIESPSDVEVNEESFQDVVSALPNRVASWRVDISRRIGMLCAPHQTHFNRQFHLPEDRLTLAVSVFRCVMWTFEHPFEEIACFFKESEDGWLWYPEVLHHECNRIGVPTSDAEHRDQTLRCSERIPYWIQRRQYSTECLRYDPTASGVAARLIQICGLDPEITIMAKMDQLDARFVCLTCGLLPKEQHQVVLAMNWRRAVAHCMEKHEGDASEAFQILSVQDAAAVRLNEALAVAAPAKIEFAWNCVYCVDTPKEPSRMSKLEMRAHLVTKYVFAFSCDVRPASDTIFWGARHCNRRSQRYPRICNYRRCIVLCKSSLIDVSLFLSRRMIASRNSARLVDRNVEFDLLILNN